MTFWGLISLRLTYEKLTPKQVQLSKISLSFFSFSITLCLVSHCPCLMIGDYSTRSLNDRWWNLLWEYDYFGAHLLESNIFFIIKFKKAIEGCQKLGWSTICIYMVINDTEVDRICLVILFFFDYNRYYHGCWFTRLM